MHDTKWYVITIEKLRQALSHGLLMKKNMHRFIKSRIMVKTMYWYEHRAQKKRKKWFQKNFFKLVNNAVFRETMKKP